MTNRNRSAPSHATFQRPAPTPAQVEDRDLARLIALMERMGAGSPRGA